ncbi:MAG: ATP synthase subunit I [Gammaproteobacteria bacterium]
MSAYLLVGCQALLTLSVTAGFGLWGAWEVAYATFLGGMVCVIPQLVFAYSAFRFSGATRAKKIMNQFYRAEAFKWLLTFGLFAVIIPVLKPAALPFFLMYIAALMVFWLTPLIFKSVS